MKRTVVKPRKYEILIGVKLIIYVYSNEKQKFWYFSTFKTLLDSSLCRFYRHIPRQPLEHLVSDSRFSNNLDHKPSSLGLPVWVRLNHLTRNEVVIVGANVNVSPVTQVQLELVAWPVRLLVDEEVAPVFLGVWVSVLVLSRHVGATSDIDVSFVLQV